MGLDMKTTSLSLFRLPKSTSSSAHLFAQRIYLCNTFLS